jgi:hypothetical protein
MPLGKRTDCGDARFAGVELPFVHDVAEAMQARAAGGLLGVYGHKRRAPRHPAPL